MNFLYILFSGSHETAGGICCFHFTRAGHQRNPDFTSPDCRRGIFPMVCNASNGTDDSCLCGMYAHPVYKAVARIKIMKEFHL